jgi:hypothetical protein
MVRSGKNILPAFIENHLERVMGVHTGNTDALPPVARVD